MSQDIMHKKRIAPQVDLSNYEDFLNTFDDFPSIKCREESNPDERGREGIIKWVNEQPQFKNLVLTDNFFFEAMYKKKTLPRYRIGHYIYVTPRDVVRCLLSMKKGG